MKPTTTSPSASSDDALVQAVRQALDRSLAEVDRPALLRLEKARRQALAAADGGGAGPARLAEWWRADWRMRAVAQSLALAGVLLALGVWGAGLGGHIRRAAPLAGQLAAQASVEGQEADLELLSSDEQLDMLAQFEFYQWLAVEGEDAV